MITMQLTPQQAKALHSLISTARNKGRKSEWWQKLVSPLVDGQEDRPSFHDELGRAVGP